MTRPDRGGHRIFAALYDWHTAPVERAVLGPRRARLVGPLTGTVLDVGAGTGANLPHYRSADRVVAVEPDPAMRRRLVARASAAAVPVEVGDAGAEALPHADASFDAVVSAHRGHRPCRGSASRARGDVRRAAGLEPDLDAAPAHRRAVSPPPAVAGHRSRSSRTQSPSVGGS